MGKQKIAVFGSAFNPPTLGHLDVIKQLRLHSISFDQVLLVPSFKHAFAKHMLFFDIRLQMLELFILDINQPKINICSIEQSIACNDSPVYTYDLLNALQAQNINCELYFIIGPDNQKHWSKFYRANEIQEKWQVIVMEERVNIRSTLVRQKIQQNLPLDELVTPRVSEFLQKNNHLYDSPT